jgi:aspartyl-tRNA(Asn)/glutamyl-tRNA(Gln) amidotransferase subunit A
MPLFLFKEHTMTHLYALTLQQVRAGLQKKAFSLKDLWDSCYQRMVQKRPLNAFLREPDLDRLSPSLEKAQQAWTEGTARPLEGIPIAIKDLFCTQGIPTTAGSEILKTFVPPYESTVTQKLWDQGAVLWGKLAMDSFAMGSGTNSPLDVLSPWRSHDAPETPRIAGGSSSGSASAVASGAALAALGSDTGGSVRLPASFCGLSALRPTYGRCSRWGMVAFASSLDQAGAITRTLEDNALLSQIIMGHDPKDATSLPHAAPNLLASLHQDIRGLKIGIPEEYQVIPMDPEIRSHWERAQDHLRTLGCEIVPVSLPHTRYALPCYYVVAPCEAFSNLSRYDGVHCGVRAPLQSSDTLHDLYTQSRSQGFCEEVKRRIVMGAYFLSEKHQNTGYQHAQKVRHLVAQDFHQAFTSVDALLTPTTTTPAWSLHQEMSVVDTYNSDIFCVAPALAGLPALAFCTGLSQNGLPMGLQLIGKPLDESTLFKIASPLEQPVFCA